MSIRKHLSESAQVRVSTHRHVALLGTLASILLLIGAGPSLHGGTFFSNNIETVLTYNAAAKHQEITATLTHSLGNVKPPGFFSGTSWKYGGLVTETEGIVSADVLDIFGTVEHQVAPHPGEIAPGPLMIYSFTASAPGIAQPRRKQGFVDVNRRPHGTHTDTLIAQLSVVASGNEIKNYTLVLAGAHESRTSPIVDPPAVGPIELDASPSIPANGAAAAVWSASPADGELGVSVAINGIAPTDVFAADIREGGPGGPVVMNLLSSITGDPNGFIAVANSLITPDQMDSLLNEQLFLIMDTSFGPVEAQMTVIPEPSSLILLIVGVFASTMRRRELPLSASETRRVVQQCPHTRPALE